jgi:general secretion pathway protein G
MRLEAPHMKKVFHRETSSLFPKRYTLNSIRSFGFTLTELLVVIAIIGILAGVLLPNLTTARAKGRDSRRVAEIKQIQLALALYQDVNNDYPSSLSGLVSTYMNPVPTAPTPGVGYTYRRNSSTSYCLWVQLEVTLQPSDDSNCNSGGNTYYEVGP